MVEFKANISDPKSGKSYQRAIEGHQASSLLGKKIGDTVDGIFLEVPGYKLDITGGSDKDGTCMRKDLPGPRRKKLLVSKGHGFKPHKDGERRRKNFRGDTISPDITQLNFKISGRGPKKIDDLFGGGDKKEEGQ